MYNICKKLYIGSNLEKNTEITNKLKAFPDKIYELRATRMVCLYMKGNPTENVMTAVMLSFPSFHLPLPDYH